MHECLLLLLLHFSLPTLNGCTFDFPLPKLISCIFLYNCSDVFYFKLIKKAISNIYNIFTLPEPSSMIMLTEKEI